MKSFHWIAAVGLLSAGSLWAGCPESNLPSNYELTPRLSFGTSFSIRSSAGTHGTVKQAWASFVRTFIYRNDRDEVVATARVNPFSWGTRIDVVDCQGIKIGELKEDVWKSFFKVKTSYLVMDQSGRQVGKSEKLDWGNTTFDLKDAGGRAVAHIERPWLRWADRWSVSVYDKSAIDERILIMIGAFKSAADAAKSSSDDD